MITGKSKAPPHGKLLKGEEVVGLAWVAWLDGIAVDEDAAAGAWLFKSSR